MRATDLRFRSPKEKTADFELPQINSFGMRLGFSPERGKQTLGKGKRFMQYLHESRRTEGIGPGSYNLSLVPGINRLSNNRRSISETPAINPFKFYNLASLLDTYSTLRTDCNNKLMQDELNKS